MLLASHETHGSATSYSCLLPTSVRTDPSGLRSRSLPPTTTVLNCGPNPGSAPEVRRSKTVTGLRETKTMEGIVSDRVCARRSSPRACVDNHTCPMKSVAIRIALIEESLILPSLYGEQSIGGDACYAKDTDSHPENKENKLLTIVKSSRPYR